MPRVRILDRGFAIMISLGLGSSPTLRELVGELEASDVIVHLVKAPQDEEATAAALQFVTVTGGFRYLRVRIAEGLDPVTSLGLIGHELQHAREIARHSWIVDERTMEEFYRASGFAVRPRRAQSSYDTMAARRIERQVVRELQEAAVVVPVGRRSTAGKPTGNGQK